MEKASAVIRHIENGCRVDIVKGGDGGDRAEIRRPWLPMKSVVPLSEYEVKLVEVALSTRRRRTDDHIARATEPARFV